MNHIKLFETFMKSEGTDEMAVISVYLETEMAVGIFPESVAKIIYSKISRLLGKSSFYNVEMLKLKPEDDLVIIPLGGQGMFTSNASEIENSGDTVGDVVELGRDIPYDNPDKMVFRVNKELNGFTVLDGFGKVRLVPVEELLGLIQRN